MNWFFACCYKFRKVKSYLNDFRMGMVKNGHGHLVCEALKSVLKEWVYELSWIFTCWLWSNARTFGWINQHCTQYFWLLFKWWSTAAVLVGPPVLAGLVIRNRVCSSFLRAVCPGFVLKMNHYVSLNFGIVIEILVIM